MKKLLLVMMLLAVLALALAACTGGGETPADDPPPETAATPTPAPAPAETPPPVVDETDYRPLFGPYANDVHDFGGIDIVIFFPWDRTPAAGVTPEADRLLERIAHFEDRWNFNLVWREIGWDNYVARYITTTMAGDPMGHFGYIISRDLFPMFITAGIAQPLSPFGIFDQTDYYPIMVESTRFNDMLHGVRYHFGTGHGGIHGNATGVFFNTTILDREGLPSPFDLYDQGEWTWDAMMDIATRATRDLTGDGTTDQWGITARFAPHAFVASNGGGIILEQGGEFSFGLLQPQALEALTFFSELSSLPIWAPGGPWDAPMNNFAAGNVALNINQWWSINRYGHEQMDDNWGWIPMPMGPQGSNGGHMFGDEEAFMFMPSSAPNQREAAIVLQAISIDPQFDPEDWLFNMELTVRHAETLDMLYHATHNYTTRVDMFQGFGLAGPLGGAFGRIGADESAVSVMQEIEPMVYANIQDRMFGDHVNNAHRQLAQAAAQVRMSIFGRFIEWEEVEDGDNIPHVYLEHTHNDVDYVYTYEEVRDLIAYAWEALNEALELFTEEEIENFGGFNNMRVVTEALDEM